MWDAELKHSGKRSERGREELRCLVDEVRVNEPHGADATSSLAISNTLCLVPIVPLLQRFCDETHVWEVSVEFDLTFEKVTTTAHSTLHAPGQSMIR